MIVMVMEKEVKVFNPAFSVGDVSSVSDGLSYECRIIDTYLDTPDGSGFLEKDVQVRIREVDGVPYLTVKGPNCSDEGYKLKEEYEVLVTDFARDALLEMGRVSLVLEKNRSAFRYNGLELCYDTVFSVSKGYYGRVPFSYMNLWQSMLMTDIFEIEGEYEDEIEIVCRRLGISSEDITDVSNYEYFMGLFPDVF